MPHKGSLRLAGREKTTGKSWNLSDQVKFSKVTRSKDRADDRQSGSNVRVMSVCMKIATIIINEFPSGICNAEVQGCLDTQVSGIQFM